MSEQNGAHNIPPIPTKEIGELLEMVSQKVPGLVRDLLGTIYSEEAGTRMGKAVGQFYKELVQSGIPAKEALDMTKDYMNTVQSFAKGMVPNSIVNNTVVDGKAHQG